MLTGLANQLPGTNIRLKEILTANAQCRRCVDHYTLEFELIAAVKCNVNFFLQGADATADIVLVIVFDGFVF